MKKSPKIRSRDPVKTRARILEVAFTEILKGGFQGVSIDQIVDKTQMTKGAFFHHFPTKQALGYALVDEILSEMVLDRWIRPLEEYDNPIEGIVKVLKKVIDATPDEHIPLGCPLNNLIQEMSSVDPVFRDKLRDVLELWMDGIEGYLRKAKQRGFLKKEINPRQLAEFIVMNHEGAFGMTKSLRDRKVFRSLHAMLKSYLDSATIAK
ncbi:MAG: TetR/AcrR family transcriptional regulator [Nitrospirae bacterium]|nr:TetR/AcrR family transcriptional regulator [Nitrospirota bacterium]MBI3351046.1 TetR/AcrR family transcriptional regulator [Nitrospirota bacterium]